METTEKIYCCDRNDNVALEVALANNNNNNHAI